MKHHHGSLMLAWLILFVLIAGLLAGCSDSDTDVAYVISGTVKEKINGILVPASDAVVEVTENGFLLNTLKTDQGGAFSLKVASGVYSLYFKKAGSDGFSSTLDTATYPNRKRRLNTAAGVTTTNVTFSSDPEYMRVIQEPEDGQSPLVDLIKSASDSIRISIYQIVDEDYQMDTDILNALAKASANGVSVQFLFNDFNNTDWPASGKKYLEYEERYATDNNMSYQLSSAAFTYTHNKYMIIDDCLVVIMTGNLDSGSFPPGGYTKNFYMVDTYTEYVDYRRTCSATTRRTG